MTITPDTKPRQVQQWYRDHHGQIKLWTAQRALKVIRGDSESIQAQQFELLPAYAARLCNQDPGAVVKLRINPTSSRFESIFICPASSRHAWSHIRPFIAVDAAFTKVIHRFVLVIAATVDANNQGLVLAWGLAPKEDYEHWGWFLQNLEEALGSLQGVVIMSDRQKGLNKAIARHLPGVIEAFCCKHIERNLMERFKSREVVGLFWEAVYAREEELFEAILAKLGQVNEE